MTVVRVVLVVVTVAVMMVAVFELIGDGVVGRLRRKMMMKRTEEG